MKTALSLLILTGIHISLMAQTWTADQLDKANTAKNVPVISTIEKEAIQYINLARSYPKEFCKYEVMNYYGPKGYCEYYKDSPYRKSLINDLKTMKPVGVIYFYEAYYKTAKCLADEQSVNGNRGHDRINCTQMAGYGECCSYGMRNGKDIALQWLIDDGVESLGHRIACLNVSYTKIGICARTHPTSGNCAVADFG